MQGDKTGDEPLSETVKQYIKAKYQKPGNVFLGVVHRLDRPVSGLVVFAKTSKALSRLNNMFRDGEVHKTYWAIVKNKPRLEEAELVNWIVRNEKQNKSRKLVNKPMLPHLAYGSRSQLTEEVLANAEAEMKEELLAEGKPEAILGKIIPGKVAKFIIDNTKVDQAYTLLGQLYVMDDSKTVEAFLESKGAKVVAFTRYEVGEGIEKAENNFAAEVAEAAGLA